VSDRFSKAVRSAIMARIKRANTKPEMKVRRLLHSLGYRFRTQLKGVPGRPDVAFIKKRKAVFIHGCFWHSHDGCPHARIPSTRTDFWRNKFARNKERDQRLIGAATDQGWSTIVIWECELDQANLSTRLRNFLGPPKTTERKRAAR